MSIHRLDRVQRVPIPLDQAWAFFSNPKNLPEITPPDLSLIPTGDVPSETHAGLVITYQVRPMFGIAIDWVTEITHVEPGRMFVDEQRFGPYAFWHHQHHFRDVPGGVEIADVIHYKLPFGLLGFVVRGTIRKRLDAIFEFRRKALEKRFGVLA